MDGRPQIVLDTNVLVAGLRSPFGASYALLQVIPWGMCDLHISVPVVIEYQDVLLRRREHLGMSVEEVEFVLDNVCAVARHHNIHFLWRPVLVDPKDEAFLELAVAAGARWIVTHNVRHFAGSEVFGVLAITPLECMSMLREFA